MLETVVLPVCEHTHIYLTRLTVFLDLFSRGSDSLGDDWRRGKVKVACRSVLPGRTGLQVGAGDASEGGSSAGGAPAGSLEHGHRTAALLYRTHPLSTAGNTD